MIDENFLALCEEVAVFSLALLLFIDDAGHIH